MKWMIASDIHGSEPWCRKMLERFEEEGAERLLLLGDFLYHGPRNGLPEGYDPRAVLSMLNGRREKLLAVRGNCDGEVDQMVLEFPILAEYALLAVDGLRIYATHGHHGCEASPPPLCPGDLLLCGHTHVPACNAHGTFTYLNPGSVSLPKEGSRHSYMTLEDGTFFWKDVSDGSVYRTFTPGPIM